MLQIYLGQEEETCNKEVLLPLLDGGSKGFLDRADGFIPLSDLYEVAIQNISADVPIQGSVISIYLPEGDIWVNCGQCPPNPKIRFPAWDFARHNASVQYLELILGQDQI